MKHLTRSIRRRLLCLTFFAAARPATTTLNQNKQKNKTKKGFLVAALEHADGSAGCARLATGATRLFRGLGSGAALEAKCEYRAGEIATLLALLGELNEGEFCEFFFRLGVRKGEKPHRA